MSIADLRQQYALATLLEDGLADTPHAQFDLWFNEALAAGVPEPNAMTLATATAEGRPSARIVLLKGYDAQGFVFYTNYQSRKGQDLAGNPYAALLFFWQPLERQVRIEGRLTQTPPAESDAYFHSRPLGSRIGAWASPQSQTIDRETLQARVQSLSASLGDTPSRPEHWGGYRLDPEHVEFWQGRPSRLHDRLCYDRNASGWTIQRLAP